MGVFIATNFQAGNSVVEWALFNCSMVDDAFWDVSVVPQGTNNEVEITRIRVTSDAAGVRCLRYTVSNNTANDTNFTRGAVRLP